MRGCDNSRIDRELGYGFFQIIAKEKAGMQKILMLTPHLT